MKQEINFLSSFGRRAPMFPAAIIFLLLAVMATVCLFFSVVFGLQQILRSQDLHALERDLEANTAAFQKIVQAYPMFALAKPLVEQVAHAEAEYKLKLQHFGEMTHQTLREPFSHYLKALSATVPEGLWLTEFYVDEDTGSISLKGLTLNPVLVSDFLQALQASATFTGSAFDLFFVKKVKNKDYVKFEIANTKLKSLDEEKAEQAKLAAVGERPELNIPPTTAKD